MEQLIEAFGIDVRLIIVQVINFTLLLVLLSYFLYTPVLRVLKERKDKIIQSIKDAEAAAAAKASAEEEKQHILTAANSEAEQLHARAQQQANENAETIIATAHNKAETVVSAAEQETAEIKRKAQVESENDIAKTALLAAEKIMREKS